MAVEGPVSIMPILSPGTLRFDPARDLAPVAMVAALPLVLVGRPDLPAADLAGLIAHARGRPDGLTYATSGPGTILHLTGAVIAERTGATLEHVPYRIASQIPADVMASRLDLAILTVTSAAPLVREGRVKGYAISSPEPSPALLDVPPLASLPALAGLSMEGWQGLFAPAATPQPILARLAGAVAEMLAEPATREKLASLGMTPSALTPATLPGFLAEERQRFGHIIRTGNITLD